MTAPWAPMHDPPLPTRNDPMRMTCEHGFREEDCYRNGGAHTPEEFNLEGLQAAEIQGFLDGVSEGLKNRAQRRADSRSRARITQRITKHLASYE